MKKIIKAIYTIIPFKKGLFSALKTVWKPKESVFKHLHFKGRITVRVTPTKKFRIHHFGFWIENDIFWRGLGNGWEKESLKLWIKLCEDSKTIFDIGANTGVYSLVAKAVNPESNVYAFEPEAMFFDCLQKNIDLNNFDIHSYRKAISDLDGEVVIEDYSGKTESLKVECVTLDSFIKQNNITGIELIKIDVEKHEPQVLKGFSEYIKVFKPTLLIEILNAEIAETVLSAVNGLGYLYFNIDEKGSVRQTQKIEQSDYYNYLLCNESVANKLGLL